MSTVNQITDQSLIRKRTKKQMQSCNIVHKQQGRNNALTLTGLLALSVYAYRLKYTEKAVVCTENK